MKEIDYENFNATHAKQIAQNEIKYVLDEIFKAAKKKK